MAGTTGRSSREHSAGWAEHTAAGFVLHELDGGHFFLHDRLPDLLDLIRTDLTAAVGSGATGLAHPPVPPPARPTHPDRRATPAPAAGASPGTVGPVAAPG